MYNVSVTRYSLPKAHIPLVLCIIFIIHNVAVAQLFLPEVRGDVGIHAGPCFVSPYPSPSSASTWAVGRSNGPVRDGIRRSRLHESTTYG